MTDLISKISSYNLFNNLVPGVILSYLLDSMNIYTVSAGYLVTDLIVFYFIGMVVSRFGSLVVEPALKKLKIVKYSEYKKYLIACEKDPRLPIIVEENNQYRTYISLFALILAAAAFKKVSVSYGLPDHLIKVIVVAILLIIFVLAYRKQTRFIRMRVDRHTE